MATLRAIIDALRTASHENQPAVLATVVRITGSSYGGVGTRMLIRIDGSTIGIVSGGCLESDLAEHAREVSESGEARLVTYDTRADDDAVWGLGLGCNGLIDVMLEPLDPAHSRELASLLDKAITSPSASVMATVIAGASAAKIGAHALIAPDGMQTTGTWNSQSALDAVRAAAPEAVSERRRGIVREFESITVSYEVIVPAINLVICGSGPDVLPVARFAVDLGWSVTVVDHRPVTGEHAARFPGALVIESLNPGDFTRVARIDGQTAVVVMSHNYARDLEYLRAALATGAKYIGVLGPRARSERMFADMGAAGDALQHTERVHSPIGLNIGGDGPDGIALAIVAEISAVMTD
ncbi:MAG TPA: XdhC family protein, partial [Gemmatimonadaceae bacterium]